MNFKYSIKQIEKKYSELDLKDSWRFLYTPKSTLLDNNGLVIMGLNPGGTADEPIPSVESGNAFLTEEWGSLFQAKTVKFMRGIALTTGLDFESMMNNSLTSNAVPFRSSNFQSLENKWEAFKFARNLWLPILSEQPPKLVICLGNGREWSSYTLVRKIIGCTAPVKTYEKTIGTNTIKISRNAYTTVIGLPHFSNWANNVDNPQLLTTIYAACFAFASHCKTKKTTNKVVVSSALSS